MIAIEHRFTGATLCEFGVETVKQAAEKAVKEGADLQGAYLHGAYLRGASIDGEKIEKAPLSIYGLRYWFLITEGFMRLGCKRFTHNEWENFSDDEINDMDLGALEFWEQWKDQLLSMCAAHKLVVEEVTA